jgi:hypothetical protein
MDFLLPFLGINLIFSIVSFVLFSASVWLTSKWLKFSKQDLRTALMTGLKYVVLSFFITFASAILNSAGVWIASLTFGILAIIVILIAPVYLIGRSYDVSWKQAALAGFIVLIAYAILMALLIVPIILWQMGVFNPPSETDYSGWEQLWASLPSVSYNSNQVFTATFKSWIDNNININSVKVNESISGQSCSVSINNVPASKLEETPQSVSYNSEFTLQAVCPEANRMRGDAYNMSITIYYTMITAPNWTTEYHEETGKIWGKVK